MKIKEHTISGAQIAEVISDDIMIKTAGDALDLLGSLYYQGFDKVIIHEKNITSVFFDLKNGMAGDILQKFSNYRFKLAIIGSFEKYTSRSLQDFIRESNKGRLINFVRSAEEALQ